MVTVGNLKKTVTSRQTILLRIWIKFSRPVSKYCDGLILMHFWVFRWYFFVFGANLKVVIDNFCSALGFHTTSNCTDRAARFNETTPFCKTKTALNHQINVVECAHFLWPMKGKTANLAFHQQHLPSDNEKKIKGKSSKLNEFHCYTLATPDSRHHFQFHKLVKI